MRVFGWDNIPPKNIFLFGQHFTKIFSVGKYVIFRIYYTQKFLTKNVFFYNLFGLVTSETVERGEVPFSKHFATIYVLWESFPADFLGALPRLKFYVLKC